MPDQPQTADDVKALVEERDIRFIRLWFTDILGQLKSFSVNREELDDAFEGGMGFDGSSITGFNAIEESDMIAMPDAVHLRAPPVAPRGQGSGPDVLRRGHPEPRAVRGRPPPRASPGARARRGHGLRHVQRGPRARVLLLPQRPARERRAGGPRRGRLLRPHHARRRLGRSPRDRARARAARDPHRVHPPRGRALAARDRHALRAGAQDGGRLHDVPHHGQGVRDEVRVARDLHAQAALRRERVRHAHPPVALPRRPQRLLRPGRPVLPLGHRQAVHRGSAQARSRGLRRSSPSG